MPTLAIVSPNDRPVFEATFPQAFAGKHVVVEQLVLHSSLDMVDEKVRFRARTVPMLFLLPSLCLELLTLEFMTPTCMPS